ncbi:MAG: hypothetical protein SGJ18_14475 [Pseudomonadota bacterium]|nr:hypothetical protein [Pseudomonadota bacterium]
MGEIFFTIKMGFLTFVIVMLMQIQMGTQTIEQHSLNWIRTSSMVDQLQEVADGGIIAMRKMFSFVTKNMNADFFKNFDKENQAGFRHLRAGLARSGAFIEEKAMNAKKKVTEKIGKKIDEHTATQTDTIENEANEDEQSSE